MADLWNMYDGEPWLDNPLAFVVNRKRRSRKGKKGKKVMARRRRRTGRRAAPRRRRVYRRRRRAVSLRSNPPRRQYRRRRSRGLRAAPRRRRYRRNPGVSLAGLNLTELLKGAGAVIVAPMIEKNLMPMLPASLAGSRMGRWAVRAGSALATWYLAKMAFGRRSADVVAIALGSSLLADAVQEFIPGITGGVSAYTRGGLRAYPGGMRRGLGLVTPGMNARRLGAGRASMSIATGTDVFAPPF